MLNAPLSDMELIRSWNVARTAFDEATHALQTLKNDTVAQEASLKASERAFAEMLALNKEAMRRNLFLVRTIDPVLSAD